MVLIILIDTIYVIIFHYANMCQLLCNNNVTEIFFSALKHMPN